jgi:ATP-dependent protease ClpP protease subunit
MSKRNLPKAQFSARSELRTVTSVKAFDRWRPEVQAKDETSDNTISVLDVIGEDFWTGQGVTLNRVAAALRQIGPRDVVVNVNSPGGDFFEGLAIYNALRDHPAKVTVKVMGIAASAASVIAMAGDEILIARAGFFMIHNTWVMAAGDRHAMREVAAWLEPFDAVSADIYAARTGLDPKTISKMLDRETWIGGAEAVDQGFADGFLAADEVIEKETTKAKALRAERMVEQSLRAQGLSSRDGKTVMAQMKGVARDADLSAARDAGAIAGVQQLLRDLQNT